MERIDVLVPGARVKFEDWIVNRGGVQIWENVNLSTPRAGQWFTPALTNGQPTPTPHWSTVVGERVIDIDRFRFVKEMKEVKRFHVATRISGSGIMLKCTDASSRKIEKALEKFLGTCYHFDYDTQEAIIEMPIFE
jgi:hypothetical protein